MESTVTIGLDLGKSVFQIHGVDAGGGCRPASADTGQAAGVLREAGTLPGRDGSLRGGPPLGKRAQQAGAQGAIDAAPLCEGEPSTHGAKPTRGREFSRRKLNRPHVRR